MNSLLGKWREVYMIESFRYTCGHCGSSLASNTGYRATGEGQSPPPVFGAIYICHHCNRPTYFEPDAGVQIPGVDLGCSVAHLPSDVGGLYEEARRCSSAG